MIKFQLNPLAIALLLFTGTTFISRPLRADLQYTTSSFGNTFDGSNGKWVQNMAAAMCVSPDGTCYVNSSYDEGGRECGVYRNGDVVGSMSTLHGWSRLGGRAVTSDGKYVYVAMVQGHVNNTPTSQYPPAGTTWYCVRRYLLTGTPAPWLDGSGYDKSMLVIRRSTSSSAEPDDDVSGIAVVDKELFVSNSNSNAVEVYSIANPTLITPTAQFTVPHPMQIASSIADDTVWVVERPTGLHPLVGHFSASGAQLGSALDDAGDPCAIAALSNGNLMIADGGARQQILVIRHPGDSQAHVDAIGVSGGIFSNPRGTSGPLKFAGLVGVGTDTKGDIFVCNSTDGSPSAPKIGTVLECLSPDLKPLWKLEGLVFVDGADADSSSDGEDVFTASKHFVLHYNPNSLSDWTYAGSTLDPQRFPQDPRILNGRSDSPMIRWIDGKKFLFLLDSYGMSLEIFRFVDGDETAIPCGMLAARTLDFGALKPPVPQPAWGTWIWRPGNADSLYKSADFQQAHVGSPYYNKEFTVWGWWVDSAGSIWEVAQGGEIFCLKAQGLDNNGAPIYSLDNVLQFSPPAPFNSGKQGTAIERLEYFPDTDTMDLTGFAGGESGAKPWGLAGDLVARYSHWSTTSSPVPDWATTIPYNTSASTNVGNKLPKSFAVSKNYVFVGYVTGTGMTSYSGGGEILVLDEFTGKILGEMEPKTVGGWLDILNSITACDRSDGSTLAFVEDDLHAKIILYTLPSAH